MGHIVSSERIQTWARWPDHQHLRQELREQIEYKYSIGQHNLLPHDRHWMQQPIATILNYDTSTQQQWIQSVNNARERHHAHPTEDPTLNQQRELLRNWLQQPHQTLKKIQRVLEDFTINGTISDALKAHQGQ